MKFVTKILMAGALAGAMAGALAACSDGYMDLSPEGDFTAATVFHTTDMLDGAVNGLSQIMSESYSSDGFGRQGNNGEGTIILWYGAYGGHDAQYSDATSYTTVVNRNFHSSSSHNYTYYPWYYYYMLIANANNILENADGAEGAQKEKDFYKAQALVYRAHAYAQLAGLYCKRWSDSNGGSSRGVPLRIDTSTGDIACSSLLHVYDRIYADLDEALSLFESSGMNRGSKLWRTDASVAHAVYARAALSREDWATAAKHAPLARAGYALMGADEYQQGFNTANSEWIWETYTDAVENLGVYGFFAYCGSNTPSSKGYKYVGSIDRGLFAQIPEEDSRRFMFAYPLEGESGWDTSGSGRVKKGDFYDRIRATYYTDLEWLYSSTYIYPWMSFKFRTVTDRSIGCVCIIRAAEMIYTEAEALYRQGGNEARIRSLLEEAVAPYNPGYVCDKSGAELWEEVKLYRRFDLWGEGRGWFDQKRWGESNVRTTWANGGNWHPDFAGVGTTGGSYGPTEKNNWTICIPERETNYNSLINNNIEPDNWTEGSTDVADDNLHGDDEVDD